ncbi:uncharacterized abhydrolase domain-containing protein DDB_G0269086 [Pieris rapae]|uniref:uncharacterized abhydrolase domain-containing protein DDB_G0269086 n=1 Tax=Pieris rapae TaxID=64459 RepID=UPI001E2812E1|nr:uncharacterized abhydrolase domain-containing protein DDB_G0269086 [Pieris rapae]
MKRVKKHRIKREIPESSQIRHEEHDLAYYIHDRVELMHQVFSVLKHKELRAMAPECIRHISLDDLQELCTEELLGISSKRLCAILDGADPPSNTESSSSSPERFETISLDSISSDEEILSQGSSKRNKKHKHHRHSKSKHKDKHKESEKPDEDDNNKASRAGLTVLELLELQARARAIRAQLQQHQALVSTEQTENQASSSGDDDEVVIKEEAPEVVEISSEDEKPSVQELQRIVESTKPKETRNPCSPVEENTNTVTKRINDLIITVPQTKASRKIKLNRPKTNKKDEIVPKEKVIDPPKTVPVPIGKDIVKDKKKKKQKKKDKQKDGSDHDEITLQLSDSEKMDLLEDFDRNRPSSEDSDSSSETSQSSSMCNDKCSKKENKTSNSSDLNHHRSKTIENDATIPHQSRIMDEAKEIPETDKRSENESKNMKANKSETDVTASCDGKAVVGSEISSVNQENETVANVSSNENIEKVATEIETETLDKMDTEESTITTHTNDIVASISEDKNSIIQDKECKISNGISKTLEQEETNSAEDGEIVNKNLSDGELSEHSIPEQSIETEVVCISDEENKTKKKKKKDKKSKKSKKSDFRESADQNFYKIQTTDSAEAKSTVVKIDLDEDKTNLSPIKKIDSNNLATDDKSNIKEILDTDESIDDVFEYLELSDDSSCFEVEGISILSKEPTAKEIAALSAKIDDIKREDVITEEEIREFERLEHDRNEFEEVENISWKDRYLESKKVKSVLSTANILNAMRKKNKKLKKHIEDTKKDQVEVIIETPLLARNDQLIEGSIQHYNTLQGSTKFVDPVREEEVVTEKVSKEMEKDAKQLLKMYKKLLKYNNMNKKKDPNKKRKKKQKKNKEKHKDSDKSIS